MYFLKLSNARNKQLIKKYGETVSIAGKSYKIIYVKELNSGDTIGLCDRENRLIYITDSKDIEYTLVHEIFHAQVGEVGLTQAPSFTQDIEEMSAESAALSISDNYKLVKKG